MQLVYRKYTVRLRNDKALRELLVGRKLLSLAMMPTALLIFDRVYSLCGTSKRGDYQSKHRGISHNVLVQD